MKNFKRLFLIAWVALTATGCSVNSPLGQIVMSGDFPDYQLYTYDFASQELKSMGIPSRGDNHAWSPDYTQVVHDCYIDQQTNLCLSSRDGLTTEILLKSDHSYGRSFRSWATWTPDGKGITFVTTPPVPWDENDRATLYTVNVQTKEVVQLIDLPNNLGYVSALAWISEDELLIGLTENIHTGHILVWDTQTWTPRKLAEGLYPTWSPDAKRIAYHRHSACLSEQACFTKSPDKDTFRPLYSSRFDIFTIDPEGREETLVLNTFDLPDQTICPASFGFAWSPDGRYLAFTEACGESDPGDLYILRVADGHVERIIEDIGIFPHVLSWIGILPKQ
ncbi:MAG: hypothetical protein GY833_24705 [Aestuariibacter sp.]|nr:hypothetical protein [Aestuariibacter sp.]